MTHFRKINLTFALALLLVTCSFFSRSQTVTNGSLNGAPVGNSQIAAGSAAGWSVCAFSPDLCNTTFPSYVSTSQIPSSPSPDGGNWLGIAALGECAQTTITGLTPGNSYTLYFCGACFGTQALFNSSPATPLVCVGATCQTYSIPMGPGWNSFSLNFVANAATMTLQARAPSANYYACLDGFNLVGPCSTPQIPVANFSVNDTTICSGTCLSFTDLSTNTPTNWAWTFAGATPNTSTQQSPTNVCYNTPGTYTATLTASNAFGNSSFSRVIRVYAPATNTVSATICAGDSLLINGIYRTGAGAYADTFATVQGCDSVVTTNLSVSAIPVYSQSISICTGDSVLVNGDYLNAAGVYVDTLVATNGCDSIVTTTITVLTIPVNSQSISICPGDSVLVNGNYLTTAGVYLDTLTTTNGCDSILTTTITEFVVPTSNQSISICPGDSALVNGNYLSEAGFYIDTLNATTGCDSFVITTITLLAIPSGSQTITICSGDNVLINGIYRSSAGIYIDTIAVANGCDSILATTLTLLTIPASSQTLSICTGDSILINGYYQSAAGVYDDTLTASTGCDSIVITTLTLLTVPASNQTLSICPGDSVLINGYYQSAAGVYDDTLTASTGCDSIVITTLTLLTVPASSQTLSICTGDSVLINGIYQSAAGVYIDTLTTLNGCDSVVSVSLLLTSIEDVNLGPDTSLCPGEVLLLDASVPQSIYLWQDNSTDATFTVTGKGIYWVNVARDNCIERDTVLVGEEEAGCNCSLFAPNVFTPNNDGNNDRFNVFANCTIMDIQLTVFNRWGEKVFDAFDELYGWDGTYKGQAAPAGVYVYLIKYRLAKGNFIANHGSLTLVR